MTVIIVNNVDVICISLRCTYSNGNFLSKGVDVQDTAVTGTDNVLGVNEANVCLEGSDSLDRLLNRGKDKTGGNVSVGNTRDSHSDVVTTECHVHVF